MNLPTTREHSYGANEPVRSNDINAIQDSIIGAKFPTTPHPFAAAAFRSKLGTATLGAGQLTAAGADDFVASLPFKAGTRIHTITWSYNNNGAGGGVSFYLMRRKMDGTAEEFLAASVNTDLTGAAVEQTTATYDHVTEVGYVYYLEFRTSAAGQYLIGAEVNADRL